MTKQENMNDKFKQTSFLYGGNADYIDQLYAQYEQDPYCVDPEWREYFSNLSEDKKNVEDNARGASWQKKNWPRKASGELVHSLDGDWQTLEEELKKNLKKKDGAKKELKEFEIKDALFALRLIRAYRSFGHLKANLDPLGIDKNRDRYQMLSYENYGFTAEDLKKEIYLGGVLGHEKATLEEILKRLNQIYCGTIGIEYMHIADPEQRKWIRERIEKQAFEPKFNADEKRALLSKLIEAEGFEQFLDTKYKGVKRFGLDGGEALIPGLEFLIARANEHKVKKIVFGMAHRGRLNVLTQIVGKPHKAIFHEFKGGSYKPSDMAGSGDVKYHLGASCTKVIKGDSIDLTLVPNPSHLEIVNPVVIGKTRAYQDSLLKEKGKQEDLASDRSAILGVLLHGDAAFAGQGVVQEVLGLSNLKGYSISGSIHIIINNQIGFTTNPEFSRSTAYPSDVSKMIDTPVFHVNGDDVEAVAFVTKLAMDYRQKFHLPVVIDMYCYRRFGHNEGDEPAFTQPIMYKNIKAHQSLTTIYSSQLIKENVVDQNQIDEEKKKWRSYLEEELEKGSNYIPEKQSCLEDGWMNLRYGQAEDYQIIPKTGISFDSLKEIGNKLCCAPEGFKVHKTVQRFLENRKNIINEGENLDWSTAEALAFGSLLKEGKAIRLSGEDIERGTFSQRHSVIYDQETEERYVFLNHLDKTQAFYYPVNSLLSEEAVLGYEYGYSTASPYDLTIWEAQFGDFANGAQVIFDQFISSSESKWLKMSGLVCLLPHGFEGQGPEHSSARLERYLQLCAENNMQVANCTTPANYFHILRRQLHRDFRKPLILMTPKSLLRHKRAVSSLEELTENYSFQPVLLDDAERKNDQLIELKKDSEITRVVLCSGKVYYDLYEEREKRKLDHIYLLRLEELYPFPETLLGEILSRFKQAEIIWCQEEPKNMGAWTFIEPRIEKVLTYIGSTKKRSRYVGRPESASPSAGLMSDHLQQLSKFLEDVFS